MSAISGLASGNFARRNGAVDSEFAGLHKSDRRAKAHRVKEFRVVGLRTPCSTAALMPFSPVVNSTLRFIRYSAGKSLPDLKREIQQHVGRVRSLLNLAGEFDDSLKKAIQGTPSEAIDETCVSGETTARMEEVEEKTEICIIPKDANLHAGFVILLASKDSGEAAYVEKKLKSENGLKLPDGAVVTTAAESVHLGERGAFNINVYFDSLSTTQFGRLVLHSSLIPSTQTLLSQNFHSFPAGTICVADAQLQGKGRGGNVWQSPKGCLMFSFTTQMTNGRMVPFLQYVVSLAVIEAVEETCKASRIPAPDVRIKWPNDLYAKGLKIGGVLCTSSYRSKTFNIVVGVGLNVGNREPTTCLDALIEELHGGSAPIQQELLLAAIMSRFEILNKIFQNQGFLPLQEAYYRKWLHSGQSVVLEEREPGSSSIAHVAVTIQGLTPMGYLLASDDEGERYELHPDGNSFDFLKGLVRQKLPV